MMKRNSLLRCPIVRRCKSLNGNSQLRSPHQALAMAPRSFTTSDCHAARSLSFMTSANCGPSSSLSPSSSVLIEPRRYKGDFNSNTFHNSNPQHGASYDQQERKARDDEIEDFLLSVKGWDHNPNTDAIKKTFVFSDFDQAYEFMGRLFAFSWGVDKYTPVTWHGNKITVELYSAHFKGLSKRELKIAAFCNDHFNMIRKSAQQVDKLKQFSDRSTMERLVGAEVKREAQERDRVLNEPSPEAKGNATSWSTLIGQKI